MELFKYEEEELERYEGCEGLERQEGYVEQRYVSLQVQVLHLAIVCAIESPANHHLLSTGNSATEVPKDDLKLGKTKSKDSKPAPDDILAIVDEAEEKPASPKEDKKSAKSAAGWGSLWGSSKTSKDKEKDAKKEKAEAQKKADEDAFAAALDDDPGDILDFVDEGAG